MKILKARASNSAVSVLRCFFFLFYHFIFEVPKREALSIQSGLNSNFNDGMRWPKPQPVFDYVKTLFHISC